VIHRFFTETKMNARTYGVHRDPVARSAGVALVAVLHVILIWGLADGLARRVVDAVKGPMVTRILPPPPEVKKAEPPPLPPRIITPPPPYIPPPVVNVAVAASSNTISVAPSAALGDPPVSAPVAPAPAAPPAPAIPDRDVSEVPVGGAAPVYPASMQERQREGWATVACVVDATGATSDCTLLEAHGGHAFGDSALDYARSQRYHPAIHNGQPITKRKIWRLNFTLG
jgi:periplasmic protein TonB